MPYTSDRRLYLDRSGNVVEEGDPNAATLLVGAGGEVPDDVAAQYGLVNTPTEAKAVQSAPENKAVSKAPANKSKA